VCFVVR
jgi:hypothetical protein